MCRHYFLRQLVLGLQRQAAGQKKKRQTYHQCDLDNIKFSTVRSLRGGCFHLISVLYM